MKISLLTPDISGNCAGRALILARALQWDHDVEIVGPAFSGQVWPALAGEGLTCKAVPVSDGALRWPRWSTFLEWIDGDVIYASKPLATSFGIGLWSRLVTDRQLFLDIDDWEAGFVRGALRELPPWRSVRYLLGSAVRPHLLHSFWNNLFFERLAPLAHNITVSNAFLQRRFGGTLVWHGRDTEVLRPGRHPKRELRREHGLPEDASVAMFLGTLRPHKGVEDLVEAVAEVEDLGLVLVLVGVGTSEYDQSIVALARRRLRARFFRFGPQGFQQVPRFLGLADLAVVPQRAGPATLGQVPAKLFDAMAMGVPLVTTAVGEIPEVVGDCAWVVDPDAPARLAEAIRDVLSRPDEARSRARRARRRCEERYSFAAMRRALLGVFPDGTGRGHARPTPSRRAEDQTR